MLGLAALNQSDGARQSGAVAGAQAPSEGGDVDDAGRMKRGHAAL